MNAMIADHFTEMNKLYTCKVLSCRNYPRLCLLIEGMNWPLPTEHYKHC